MISKKGVKHWTSTTVGIVFFVLGLIMFLDCWFEVSGTCGTEAKFYIGGAFLLGLMFLFLDENDIRAYIKRVADSVINKFSKNED